MTASARAVRRAQLVDPEHTRFANWWLRPPGWIFWGACTLGAAGLLWSLTTVGGGFFLGVGAIGILALCAVAWVFRVSVLLILTGLSGPRRTWAALAAIPVCGLLVAGLVVTEAPLHLRWAHSRSAFEAAVAELPADGSSGGTMPSRLGTYRVLAIERVGTGVYFFEADSGLFDDAGFAYLPDGPDPDAAAGTFERLSVSDLSGNWYTWTSSW